MSTATTPVASAPLTLEQKILVATEQSAQVASIFSPAVAQAIAMGVQLEPVLHGFVQMITALFKHHTSQAVPPATT